MYFFGILNIVDIYFIFIGVLFYIGNKWQWLLIIDKHYILFLILYVIKITFWFDRNK